MLLRSLLVLAVAAPAAFASLCLSGTAQMWETVTLTFQLDEDCCDWEFSSCGAPRTSTTISGVEGPGVNMEGDSNPGICPNPCEAWAEPDVLNREHGYSFVTPDTNPPECLSAGIYTLQLYVAYGYDENCQQVTEDIPYEVCFTYCEGGVVEAAELPGSFGLDPAFPNPFNPSTTLSYRLDQTGPASLIVRDLLGREVARLADGMQEAGEHQVVLHAETLASGVYTCTLESAGQVESRKLLLLK